MGASEKTKCVVLVEKELFEDGAANYDNVPMFHWVYPVHPKKLPVHINIHAIFDHSSNKYERDAENDTHLM